MRRIYKSAIFIFLLLGTISCYSQNIIQGSDAGQEFEAMARAEAEEWTVKLAMTAKQTALMEDRLVEYAVKRDQVLYSKMREAVKARMLTELELAENKSMRDILTKLQYDRFLFLKRKQVQQKAKPINNQDSLDHFSGEN